MLIFSNNTALVILRGFKGDNPRTWTIPGGNVDSDDADLLETAEREMKEEIGRMPKNITIVSKIKTVRGDDDNEFTVFLGKIPVESKSIFYPILNSEHTNWKWFPMKELYALHNKHPVLEKLIDNHEDEINEAFSLDALD